MARRATQIAEALKLVPEITAIAGQRVFDQDYRDDGWESAPVSIYDADLVILPTIMVVDGEGVHQLGSPAAAESNGVFVWALSTKSTEGYNDVNDLMVLAKEYLLTQPQLLDRLSLSWSASVGPFTANDGCVGRLTFTLNGIPKRRIGA